MCVHVWTKICVVCCVGYIDRMCGACLWLVRAEQCVD